MATIHIVENPFPNVPAPAGATKVYEWDDLGTGTPARYWSAPPRRVIGETLRAKYGFGLARDSFAIRVGHKQL